jgi:hypothetical protein
MVRSPLLRVCVLLPVIGCGCALTDTGRNWLTGVRSDQTEPDLGEDKWAFVGKEGRGGRPTEKADWFDKYLSSPQAREINRNFNIE